MYPIIDIFGRELATYSLLFLAGVLACGVFACVMAQRRGLGYTRMTEVILVSAVGVLIGGHILYAITNIHNIGAFWAAITEQIDESKTFTRLFQMALFLFGGSVFYGGLIGGLISGLLYIRHIKVDMPLYADIMGAGTPLFHAFGRIGCFMGGCCYGVESDFGYVFTRSIVPGANGVRRLPVQLFESGFEFALFLAMFFLLTRKSRRLNGKILPIYLLAYSIWRFIIEFYRGDNIRGFVGALSTSQFVSVFIFVGTALFLLLNAYKKSVRQ